jgi:hypothetical protein
LIVDNLFFALSTGTQDGGKKMYRWLWALQLCVLALICLNFAPMQATIMQAVTHLQQRAEASNSAAMLVTRQGRALCNYRVEDCDLQSIDLGGISRAFVAMAFVMLKDEGKIPTLDVPLYLLVPDLQISDKHLKLRQLLNNTAGWMYDSHRGMTVVAYQPGERYYRSIDDRWKVLLHLFKRLAGQSLPAYLNQKLFFPLGITSAVWSIDEEGNHFPKISMPTEELAKIGYLIINRGCWHCHRYFSPSALQELFSPSQQFDPFFGLQWDLDLYDVACWWDQELLDLYRSVGVEPVLIDHLQKLNGRVLHFGGYVHNGDLMSIRGSDPIELLGGEEGMQLLVHQVRANGVPLARFKAGKVKAAIARGADGLQWVIMPGQQIVGVRVPLRGALLDSYSDFPTLLSLLAAECDGYID